LFYGFSVLLFGLFLFLDDSLNSFGSKLSNKFVDAGIGINWEAEVNQ